MDEPEVDPNQLEDLRQKWQTATEGPGRKTGSLPEVCTPYIPSPQDDGLLTLRSLALTRIDYPWLSRTRSIFCCQIQTDVT